MEFGVDVSWLSADAEMESMKAVVSGAVVARLGRGRRRGSGADDSAAVPFFLTRATDIATATATTTRHAPR
jgi:hypothetical protein